MSYAQHPRNGPPQNTPAGYQYDDRGASQAYGYADGGGGYGGEQYEEPAPVAYHGKARYVEHAPANNFDNYGGYDDQGHGHGQAQNYDQAGYGQHGQQGQQNNYNQGGGHTQSGYSQSYQQDGRQAQQGRAEAAAYDPGYGRGNGGGGYHQQRPPPQRLGHNGAPQQQENRPQTSGRGTMNERPHPSRQYTDGGRPNTSGSAMSRGHGYPNDGQQQQQPPNAYSQKPKSSHSNSAIERPLANQPTSPQNASWDNPFGSFGGPPSKENKPRARPADGQRPSTSHSSSGQPHGGRKGSESSQAQQRPPRQASRDEYPLPNRNNYGQQDNNQAPRPYQQRPPQQQQQQQQQQQTGYGEQRSYPPSSQGPSPASAAASGMPQPTQRGGTPNFSRVQSPPIRNNQTPPNMGFERSHTMPAELPVRTVQSSTPNPSFQTDLPFREGRAQTPVYASPQYAEAQSAVIESVSDPPTATTDWTDASVGHNSYHQASRSLQSPPVQNPGHASGAGYNDVFDDYYGTASDHDHHPGHGGSHHAAEEPDMPNFDNNRGRDELHLDSGMPAPAPIRTVYGNEAPPPGPAAGGPPPQNDGYQDHGFDFGVSAQDNPYGGGYDPYSQQDSQGQRAFSSPHQGLPGQQDSRSLPPSRGGPPGRGGYPPGPGRGGYMNAQDRSVSAGPGPRPNGAPFGPPGPNGRGMPPMRGRGAPGFAGAPMPPGPGTPGPGTPGPMNSRGGPMGGRGRGPPGPGRGGPPDNGQPPAPVRPGLAQQGGPGRPAPVRQYNSAPAPGQPGPQPGPARPSAAGAAAASDGPVTQAEIQRLRIAITDNPGDQVSTLILVKKLAEASTALAGDDGRADPKTKAKNRERYVNEAYKLLKKLVSYHNQEAMFYMAECYGSGQLGLPKDMKEAFLLYQSAAKTGHAQSAYRVAVCCELGESEGGGTKRDPLKAMQWYKRAATLGDVPAMYKLGVILLKGLLGQNPQPGEAVTWLQRAADRADPENAHALHELGLLYEAPPPQVSNTVFPDQNYSYELFVQAANLGYKFSQFRLGQCYEFGQLGCPIDPRQSIAWYSKAAMQEEHQSELALSGWYLTGTEGVIQQSDTEAYLWARKAAQAGLAKAEYAMGYYTETGIGCSANLEDAKRWYWRASSQNFPKARERLEDLRRGGAKAAASRVSRTTVQRNKGDCNVM